MKTVEGVCRSCGNRELAEFYRVDNIPVNSCLVVDTPEAGRTFPRGDLRVAMCTACGYITNTAFQIERLTYDSSYEETQTFSATFNSFQDNLIARLLARHDLWGKTVIDIGCGKGDFLARMAELGDVRGIGIDPTAIQERLTGKAARNVRFINEFYGPEHGSIEADLIICRHALEHIPDVSGFLRTIREAVGTRSTPIFFELPESLRVLHETAYWDIYFEHCGYFTPGSLARAFEHAGFRVTDVRLGYDEQYLMLESAVGSSEHSYAATLDRVEDIGHDVDVFEQSVGEKLGAWRNYFDEAARSGKRVAVWGSGSKCVAFMTTLGVDSEIACVTDVNPYRHGKYLVGTGKPIVPPKDLCEIQPDEVIVMNPIYRAEVAAVLDSLGVGARVITAEAPLTALV
jgi:SAM-dependent methyltransferase